MCVVIHGATHSEGRPSSHPPGQHGNAGLLALELLPSRANVPWLCPESLGGFETAHVQQRARNLLYQTLPTRACADEWDIRYTAELDTGLTQKFAARHKATGQRGIVKCGWPGTIVKEYLWPRIVRSLDLPAAPAQLAPIPDVLLLREFGGRARRRPGTEEDGRSTCTPIGTLIHWIAPAESAAWLWDATAEECSARGVAPAVVVSLQALALWAGGLEPGEFMLAGQTPFVIDMQDGLFIDSLGRPQNPLRPPHHPESLARLQRLLAGRPWRAAERQQAVATMRSLQGLSAKQIGWIVEDAGRAVIEATLPKGLAEVILPAGQAAELQAALRSHLTRLTQDWAEQVATVIEQGVGQ